MQVVVQWVQYRGSGGGTRFFFTSFIMLARCGMMHNSTMPQLRKNYWLLCMLWGSLDLI